MITTNSVNIFHYDYIPLMSDALSLKKFIIETLSYGDQLTISRAP